MDILNKKLDITSYEPYPLFSKYESFASIPLDKPNDQYLSLEYLRYNTFFRNDDSLLGLKSADLTFVDYMPGGY